MISDYIKIGLEFYRVEINMNTVEDWETQTGQKISQFEMHAATAQKTGLNTTLMLMWLFCAIREGEQIDGHPFKVNFKEFKRMVKPSLLSVFAPIFIRQYIGNNKEAAKTIDPDVKIDNRSIWTRYKWAIVCAAVFVIAAVATLIII